MSTRLSRRAALAVGLSIVAMMVVAAPMLALADSPNGDVPSAVAGNANSAAAPGQSATPPGNSGSAPGQTSPATTTVTAPDAAPGNSGSAPGQNKPDTSTTTSPPTSSAGGNSANAGGGSSNAGGNSDNAGGGSSSAGGNSSNAGGGSSNAGGNSSNAGGGSSNGGGNSGSTGNGGGAGGSGGNGDPAGQGDCDQQSGGAGNPYGANCDGTHQNPGPGNSDNSPGKPADGTVGKADNKNPKGQAPNGNDHNKGYECEPGSTNKGVGKGNPAHTGCTPLPPRCPSNSTANAGALIPAGQTAATFCSAPPPCVNSAGTSVWTLSVAVTNGTASHTSQTYSSSPGTFTVTATAATGYNTTGGVGGVTTVSAVMSFSNSVCSQAFSASFSRITEPCPPGTQYAGQFVSPCDPTPDCNGDFDSTNNGTCNQVLDCTGDFNPNNNGSCNPTPDCNGDFDPTNNGSCSPPPPPDCDGDGIDDNVDSDISSCKPLPPGKDCDADGIPDDVDADTQTCSPGIDPDEVLGVKLCPDGVVVQPGEACPKSNFPDFVLGIRTDAAVAPAAVAPAAVKAGVLPFTGGNLLPFLLTSLAMFGVGGATLIRRKK